VVSQPVPDVAARADGDGLPRRRQAAARILVAGLGNELLADDGVGVHAARMLAAGPSCGAVVVEVGTAVLDALHLFAWADRVLAIDAMLAGGPPGTVYRFGPDSVADEGGEVSLHELGLLGTLRLLPVDELPRVTVLGVEPGDIAFGLDLSPPVAGALGTVAAEARALVEAWRRTPALA
jgi:hydrogenase maturation protease